MNKILNKIGLIFILLLTCCLSGCANHSRYDGVAMVSICAVSKNYDGSYSDEYLFSIKNGVIYNSSFSIGTLKNGSVPSKMWKGFWTYEKVGQGVFLLGVKAQKNCMYIEKPNLIGVEKLYLVDFFGTTYMLLQCYTEDFPQIHCVYRLNYGY